MMQVSLVEVSESTVTLLKVCFDGREQQGNGAAGSTGHRW